MEKLLFVGILFLMMIMFTISFYRMINEKDPGFEEEID
jgi:hypothetical protein